MLFCRKHFRLKYLNKLSFVAPTHFAFWACLQCLLDKWLPSQVFLFSRIALHCIMLVPMQSWPCASPSCPFCCIVCYTSTHSDIRIVASQFGTLDVRCVELKGDVGVNPEDGVLMNRPRRWKDRLKCKLGPELLSSWCKLTNWLCVKSQASPRV